MKKVTIQDVADAANVSKATVSRYLNGQWNRMNAQTRQKITDTIQALGYIPNQQARSLKAKHTKLVGLVVADIGNLYTSFLIKGIQAILRKQGYQLLIYDSSNNQDDEINAIKHLLAQNVEGIILQPLSTDSSHYQILLDTNSAVVLVDRQTYPLSWPTVTSDDLQATQSLLGKVLQKKYQKILIVTNALKVASTRQLRYQGILAATKNTKVDVELFEVNEDYISELTSKLASEVDQKTVVFAMNGQLLMNIIKICKKQNFNIPADIAIVGFDDTDIGDLTTPGISAIKQKPIQIGTEVALQLINAINQTNELKLNTITSAIKIRQSF